MDLSHLLHLSKSIVHSPWSIVLLCLLGFFPAVTLAKEKARIEIKVEDEKETKFSATSHGEVIIPSKTPGQAKTVTELLEHSAGVQIKQYGGLDDFAAVSIRGSTMEQVLIYVDGILLNTAHGGTLDLSMLPLDQIERIEVYKGGAPGKTADSAPGGVIYIHTKKRPDKTKNSIRNALGSFWTYRGHVERRQAFENFYYNAAFDHFRSRGDFSFLDDRGTRANTNDDRVINRQNNDFQAYDFQTTWGRGKKEGLDWKIYENFFVKHQGVPGFGAQTSSTSRLNTLRNLFELEIGKEKWRTNIFFDYSNSRFQDRQSQIGLGAQDNDDVIFRFGPEFKLNLPLANHFLSGFANHRAELFWPTNNSATPPEGPLSQRHTLGLGLEDEMSFAEDKIIIDPSGRFQTFINRLSGEDPSFSTRATENHVTNNELSGKLGVKVTPWPFLNFKTNLYRGFRQPTFGELFGDRGTIIGNPALEPEVSLNFDFGIEFKQKEMGLVDALTVSAAAFRNTIDHLIQFLQTSQFTIRAQNLNKALIMGGEFSADLRAFQNFHWNGHYVYQSAKEDESSSPTFGNFLPGRPKHQFFSAADYQFSFIKPFIELDMMGESTLDSQNLLRVTHRTLLASGVTLTPIKKLEISFSAKNILDDRVVDIVGYPLPGRSYWGEIKFDL